MKIRVLGCSGAIAAGCRTTSFLIDDVLLVDAGTGVGDLTLDEMARIDDVLLTHSHLDHIAALPLMADAIGGLRPPGRPIRVHALAGTLNALRTHVFNDVIWPDFTRLPSPGAPFITLHPVEVGQVFTVASSALQVEVLPAVHTVPAVGYAVATATQSAAPTAAPFTAVDDALPWWVFTGDTGRNPAFWKRIATMKVGALVIETAFGDAESDLAARSRHLCPSTLAEELASIPSGATYPVFVTHQKPAETDRIMGEITAATSEAASSREVAALVAGQIIHI